MISPVRSDWPTMLPRTWNRSPTAACIRPLPYLRSALPVRRRTRSRCATSPVSTLVADGWYGLCVGTARQAADPGVLVEIPSRVLGSRGIGVSRERRAWAGGGFLVPAGGSSVEAADRHPPGGW